MMKAIRRNAEVYVMNTIFDPHCVDWNIANGMKNILTFID